MEFIHTDVIYSQLWYLFTLIIIECLFTLMGFVHIH